MLTAFRCFWVDIDLFMVLIMLGQIIYWNCLFSLCWGTSHVFWKFGPRSVLQLGVLKFWWLKQDIFLNKLLLILSDEASKRIRAHMYSINVLHHDLSWFIFFGDSQGIYTHQNNWNRSIGGDDAMGYKKSNLLTPVIRGHGLHSYFLWRVVCSFEIRSLTHAERALGF